MSGTDAEVWQEVVRDSPYWISQGVFDNLQTIRKWVLTGSAYCEKRARHILFDRRARFLGYFADAETTQQTQERLNQERRKLALEGRVATWSPGAEGEIGYPFALSCNQPDAELAEALARYTGDTAAARVWGTWDGMHIGAPDDQVSLHAAIEQVYEDRLARGRISLDPEILSVLAGTILIESGGRKKAHSAADAKGILQLSGAALQDCELSPEFYFHRLAQVDCALRLLEQNHRNLQPVFQAAFGHLPPAKAAELYDLLLIQAYHAGVGRVLALLDDSETGAAADYFAQHHDRFSAGDIALGMIYHNLGRNELGFASLYYVTDIAIAKAAACEVYPDMAGC